MVSRNMFELSKHAKPIFDKGGKYFGKEWKPIRNLRQNNYYWLCMGVIADDCGVQDTVIHKYCKDVFIESEFVAFNGKVIELDKTTTDKDTKEFADYMEKVITWSHVDLGVILPDPADHNLKRIAEFYKNQIANYGKQNIRHTT